MGSILKAVCKCGFEKEFLFGGGMMDFTTVCNVPSINKESGEFTAENYFIKSTSKHLIFYNQPGMYSGSIGNNFHQWRNVKLKKKDNLCPKCLKNNMSFEIIACFD